jgi:hypothetical protein
MKNCPSWKLKHHHILCFLFVCALTTIVLFDGLGVEDQQNGLCDVFVGLHQRGSLLIKTKNLDKLKQQI